MLNSQIKENILENQVNRIVDGDFDENEMIFKTKEEYGDMVETVSNENYFNWQSIVDWYSYEWDCPDIKKSNADEFLTYGFTLWNLAFRKAFVIKKVFEEKFDVSGGDDYVALTSAVRAVLETYARSINA